MKFRLNFSLRHVRYSIAVLAVTISSLFFVPDVLRAEEEGKYHGAQKPILKSVESRKNEDRLNIKPSTNSTLSKEVPAISNTHSLEYPIQKEVLKSKGGDVKAEKVSSKWVIFSTFVIALLGGSAAAAVITILYQEKSTSRQRQMEFLNTQLRNLYGPLYFFTSQNERLFKLSRKILGAYNAEFIDKQWAEESMNDVRKEANATIDLSNEYVQMVVKNNVKVIEILQKNWQLIDWDDIPIFSQFQVDFIRFKTEVEEKAQRGTRTTFLVHEHLGNISYMRPDMIKRVEDKWEVKRNQIASLMKWAKAFNKALSADS